MNQNVEWRNVVGYEGSYQVSNLGRVRSLDRIVHYVDGRVYKYKGKMLTGECRTKHNYLLVSMSKDRKPRYEYIHRLVAKAFLPNPDNKREVNHKDGDKSNNKVSNLEWVSSKENKVHAVTVSGVNFNPRPKRGEDIGTAKLTADQARYIKFAVNVPKSHLAKMFCISSTTVRDIQNGKSWAHLT